MKKNYSKRSSNAYYKKVYWLAAIFVLFASIANAQFTGAYNLSNWTLTNNNPSSDASVNLSGAPNSFIFTGSDSGSGGCCDLYDDFEITVTSTTSLNFDYNHSNPDLDDFYYVINGTATLVTINGNGSLSVPVTAGDTFAFRIYNYDNCCGAGVLTISNFSAGSCSMTASITSQTNISCNGGSDGSSTVATSGGAAPYTYLWNDSSAQTTATATNLTAGTYEVTVTDSNGCTATASATITQPADLEANGVATNVSCNGGSNGSIDLTVTGGTSPYSYAWDNFATTEDLSGLAAGTYNVTVTDTNGCITTESVDVFEPINLTISANITNTSCSDNNGSIDLTVIGGNPPYAYVWSNSATTQDLSGLESGTYNVTVTDIKGCTETFSTSILTVDNEAPIAICNDITVQLDSNDEVTILPEDINNGSYDQSIWLNYGDASTYYSVNSDDQGFGNGTGGTVGFVVSTKEPIYFTPANSLDDKVRIGDELHINYKGSNPTYLDRTIQWRGIGNAETDVTWESSNFRNIYSIEQSGKVSGDLLNPYLPYTIKSTFLVNGVEKYLSIINGDVTFTDDDSLKTFYTLDVASGQFNECSELTYSIDVSTFDCSMLGDNQVTLTVTDTSGNSDSCTATVTVLEDTNPTANCVAPFTVYLDENGNAQISESDINDGSSDNCGVDSVSIDVTEFDCTMLGDNQVTLTVTDASGNSSTCTTTVTVVDEIIPIVQTQDITVYLDENGLASIESCDLDDGSYDNCSNDSNDIYFTGTFEGEIWKASKDGSTTPELIFTDSETAGPVGIEVDLTSNTIYYGGGNFHSIKYFEIGQTTNSILPGSTSGSERHDFEIHDGYVYYTSDGDLYKGGINSGTAISIVSTGDVIAGITLDKTNNTLYYIAQDNSWGIGKVDIDGNNEDYNYIPTSENARGVTIDESTQTLYWNSGSGNIYSSPADASTAPQLLYDISAYGSGNGYHIDLDGDDLYWTKFNDPNLDDVIFKAPKNGSGPVQVLYSGDFGSIRGIAAGRNITGNSLNCSDFQISQSSFDCTMLGENDVTLTVTDLSGNQNTGSATVTVEDNISPTASCQDVTAYLDENGNVTLDPEDFNDNSSDNTDCFTYTIDQTDFDCTMLGSNPIVFTVEDAAGNIDTCLTTVTIIDNENPTANCVAPFTISLDSNGNAQISESDVNDGSTDNCGVDSVSIDVTEFDCTMLGDNQVTLTVTDASGNSSTCTTTVTVVDETNPIANCVAPFTISLDVNGNAQISESDVNDGSTDNCGVDSISIDVTDFDCTMVGENDVTLTVTDTSGNSSTCTTTVTVIDDINPIANCVAPFTIALDGNGNAQISESDINDGSSDNCGVDSVSIDVTELDCTMLGENQIILTVTDASGNSSTCTTTVTIIDDTNPIANCVAPFTIALDANGNAQISESDINDGSSDNCGVDSVSIDVTDFDCTMVGDNQVTLTVTDASGNSSTCTTTVTVEDNESPIATCQDITVILDNTGNVSITASDIDNGSTDNCAIDSYEIDVDSFDCTMVGMNMVTLTITDTNGNSSTCTSTVTVEDNELPSISCEAITVSLDETGNISILPEDLVTDTFDNCGIENLSLDIDTFDCEDIGNPVDVTIFAQDASGNMTSCTTTVTVIDDLDPEFMCLEDQTVMGNDDESFYVVPDFVANGEVSAIDNCDGEMITISQNPPAGSLLEEGEYDFTFVTTDQNGNTAVCISTITVETGDLSVKTPEISLKSIDLYPNPAENFIIIDNPQHLQLKEMVIYDLNGRKVLTLDLENYTDNTQLNISKLEAAQYFAMIKSTNNGVVVKRILRK